jgi:hypothetical protein
VSTASPGLACLIWGGQADPVRTNSGDVPAGCLARFGALLVIMFDIGRWCRDHPLSLEMPLIGDTKQLLSLRGLSWGLHWALTPSCLCH